MILFQLYGLSKLLCDPLPYLKTKKNDLITTYAKRGTTTVHYLKLICDRRCATMSFVYFLNVWVINLDRKGYWITESEWKIVHCLAHYFRCVVSRPFVLQFAKRFFFELFLFKFYRKKCVGVNFVSLFILLFSIIQSIFALARGPQCCLPFAFFSALPSWLLSPPSLFWISRCKINSRFYYDNVFYSRLFSNWTTLFFNLPGTTYPRKFVATIYSLHMTHEYWPLLFL